MLRELNDLYLEARVVVQTLKKIKGEESDELQTISVPSTGSIPSNIKRTKKQLFQIIKREIERREFEKTIVLMVSLVEDYIMSNARILLRAFPERILKSIKGNDAKLPLELADLIKLGSDVIIENYIQQRLQSAIFASPREYTSYLNSLLGKPLRQDALDSYLEIKASRDIIVHAKNVVNQKYIEKSGDFSRGNLGDALPIDENYFKSVVQTMKRLTASIYRTMMSEYGEDEDIAAALIKERKMASNQKR